MTAPRVSVVIPTYNRAPLLRQAIESVLAQSYRTFEIVISDNCSSDGTASVVHGFQDLRIRYFRNDRNIGMVPNWNAGIRRARAEYVALLEDDNWWHPRYLERVVQTLDAHPQVAFVHTATCLTDQQGQSVRIHKRWDADRRCDGLAELRDLMRGNQIFLSTVTFRRESIQSAGLFDETIPYAADWEMWLRLYIRYSGAYLAEPLAFYRLHEGSGTARYHSEPLLLFHDHRQVIEKTVRNIRAVYGGPLARELRRSSHRWLAEVLFRRAWGFHRAGELVSARREALAAVTCAPNVVFRFPLKLSVMFFASLLPRGFGRSFLAFEKRVGRPLVRCLRFGLRGMP